MYANAIKPIKLPPSKDFSTKTILPPYHKTTAITAIPNNSLNGVAKFCLNISLLENLKISSEVLKKRFLNIDSATNPLMIFKPLNVSSKCDKNCPFSLCTLSEEARSFFPI